ncbi:protein krueppel-like [Diaphorina citri]|uniref:Protein krueppel-like n=1 Tax=Diaphorina citri TaxID=121845 RepID=A0A3Q0JMZ4_DIACI|nr:protein krueppel-like [Diaphorina citri]
MARPDRLLFKYVCFACTYHSYNVGNFKTHVRTHTGDKPFECYACGYKSASPAGMSYHRRKTGH